MSRSLQYVVTMLLLRPGSLVTWHACVSQSFIIQCFICTMSIQGGGMKGVIHMGSYNSVHEVYLLMELKYHHTFSIYCTLCSVLYNVNIISPMRLEGALCT